MGRCDAERPQPCCASVITKVTIGTLFGWTRADLLRTRRYAAFRWMMPLTSHGLHVSPLASYPVPRQTGHGLVGDRDGFSVSAMKVISRVRHVVEAFKASCDVPSSRLSNSSVCRLQLVGVTKVQRPKVTIVSGGTESGHVLSADVDDLRATIHCRTRSPC
jgi:hypothetical protein